MLEIHVSIGDNLHGNVGPVTKTQGLLMNPIFFTQHGLLIQVNW